jgi:hypothetical protein
MPSGPHESDIVWQRCKALVRREFSAVLAAAVAAGDYSQSQLFNSEEEKIIANGLDRLFYKRRLPNGSEKELALATKVIRLANLDPEDREKPEGLKGIPGLGAAILAEQYRDTFGWYYTLKPLSDGATTRWLKLKEAEEKKPESGRNQDLVWFCDLRLKGIPTQVANFKMTCFFTLLRADGKRDRVVEIETEAGEKSGKIRLDAESFSTPSGRTGFRTWLLNHSNGCWKGGERELEDLQLDMAHDSAFMDVQEVTALGEEEESGLWFYGDCCIGHGHVLTPDKDNVFWREERGFQLAETGSGSQPFAQGAPLMHPESVLQYEVPPSPLPGAAHPTESGNGEIETGVKFYLADGADVKIPEKEAVEKLFTEMVFRLEEALGGYDAYLVIGAFLSFIGRRVYFRREKCFPGLIVHGETGQGKTTLAQWGMELAGFHQMAEGIGLSRNSTVVGLQILLEQYSNLPGWLSDFNNVDVPKEKQEIMHAAYNAGLSVKWSADGTTRKSRTMFIVDGESRPSKTSTRYRYLQILVSKANRRSNQVRWFEKNRGVFFTIWRSLVLRQEQFVELMMNAFEEMSEAFGNIERRAVQVHGPAASAFLAAVGMFGNNITPAKIGQFIDFLRGKCQMASEQRELAVNVNQFWVDLISAFGRGVFGETVPEQNRFFKVTLKQLPHAPGADNKDKEGHYIQGPWESPTLYIEMNGVLDLMRKDFSQQRKTMVLEKGDLIEQMSRRPYFSERNRIKPPFKAKFGKTSLRCLAIEIDKMEDFGYRKVSDSALEESRMANGELPGVRVESDKWMDPRKGDIYSIVNALKGAPEQ